jgi:hypothetical protein
MVGVGTPVSPGAHAAVQVVPLGALVQLFVQLPPPVTAAVGLLGHAARHQTMYEVQRHLLKQWGHVETCMACA